MEFLEQYAEVKDEDGEVSDSLLVANEEDKNFVDDSAQIESQQSDYFALKNIEG